MRRIKRRLRRWLLSDLDADDGQEIHRAIVRYTSRAGRPNA